MYHTMKLNEKYFDAIKFGTKIYEIRLNDEKRKQIKKGDFIEFQKEPLKEEKYIVEVEDLLYYKNFEELLQNSKMEELSSPKTKKEELIKDLEKFYSKEEQEKYGVVAIKLKKHVYL